MAIPPHQPVLPFRHPHLSTIYPTLFRRVPPVAYELERITTPDGDFLDMDWSRVGSARAALVIHGLEGDSHRAYMQGMVRALNRRGWDVAALNLRGCSGTPNRKLRFYHSGATEDVETAVMHVHESSYRTLALVGFSLGGNLVLKYLGERGTAVPYAVQAAVALSVPVDLLGCADALERPGNVIYRWRFLRQLRAKVEAKAAQFPDRISTAAFAHIRSLRDFDEHYTAPIHGFASATDYYTRVSSLPLLPSLTVPTLLLNAANDPFLSASCYPEAVAARHAALTLRTPKYGGHVGFVQANTTGEYWSETIAGLFLQEVLDAAPVSVARP